MNQKPNDALDNRQNNLWVYDRQRDTYRAISGARVKASLEGTIPHPGRVPGAVMEGAQPIDATEPRSRCWSQIPIGWKCIWK
jgi:hypothetical protein